MQEKTIVAKEKKTFLDFVKERLEKVEKALSNLGGKQGRKAQKARWRLRKQKDRLNGDGYRDDKPTQKGAQKGAFGKCKHLPPSNPLSPSAMKAKYHPAKKPLSPEQEENIRMLSSKVMA